MASLQSELSLLRDHRRVAIQRRDDIIAQRDTSMAHITSIDDTLHTLVAQRDTICQTHFGWQLWVMPM